MEATVPLTIAGISLFFLVLGALVDDRRARARRLAKVTVEELPLLHSINDDRCIGCEACVDACPTEVLELVDHKARVVRFSDCVQCEQCANACPTTALVMYRQGGVPRTLTVPELDDHFQTGVPGQYLIGEVAGKPLVKNAANLGRAVIEHIANDLAGKPRAGADVLDVAIVGSGPGGLSAGLTCKKRGLSAIVLEKEHVISSTVARYPKGKHFMAEPSNAVNRSYLPVFDASKEDLVAAWQRVVEQVQLPIKLGEAVETVKRGDDGIFTIKTTVGTYRARTVVLATGLRGKPRLLAVPGANLEKVQSRLEDPAEFGGQHVLVVGGGDSAVEAATSLVDAGATVTLSYRGDGFKRCKQGNQKRLAELQAERRLAVLLESNVQEFTADAVTIKLKDGRVVTQPNQQAFVLIGADTPVVWLEANNVRFVEREHLYALGATEDAVLRVAPDAVECPRDPAAAVAALLGTPAKVPQRRLGFRTGPAAQVGRDRTGERSVVRLIRDGFHNAVSELTGVFKIPTADEPHAQRVTARTTSGSRALGATSGSRALGATSGSRALGRTTQLVPVANLARAPRLRTRHGGTGHGETTADMLSLPARLASRAPGASSSRDKQAVGYDSGDVTAVDEPPPAAPPAPPRAPRATPPPPPSSRPAGLPSWPVIRQASAPPPPPPRPSSSRPPVPPPAPASRPAAMSVPPPPPPPRPPAVVARVALKRVAR